MNDSESCILQCCPWFSAGVQRLGYVSGYGEANPELASFLVHCGSSVRLNFRVAQV
jgi:hypothetical protein